MGERPTIDNDINKDIQRRGHKALDKFIIKEPKTQTDRGTDTKIDTETTSTKTDVVNFDQGM